MNHDKQQIASELEELKQKEKYLKVINSFATVLFEAQSINEIVWAVAKNAIAELDYYDCVIYLFDEDKERLIQSAAYGPKHVGSERNFEPIEIAPNEGIVGTVFSSGKGEIIKDTSKDPRYIVDDAARLSEITIPLTYKGKTVGVIDSEHPEKNFFNEEDFNMLMTVAAMVSTKLAQAITTEELLAYKNNLEQLVSDKTAALEQANLTLTKKNQEKELLLKEIHHRVKNNMQIMVSLVNLQVSSTDNKDVQEVLKDFGDRIRSMAIIHERLYMEKDMNTIQIDQYIKELSQSILSSFENKQRIHINQDIEPIPMDLDTSIPLGLILNELITNSLKHAFKTQKDGEISIKLYRLKEGARFEYADNGVGFNFEETHKTSFGLDLIEILSSQIGKCLKQQSTDGSACSFTISKEHLN